jgi:hypothetical protein
MATMNSVINSCINSARKSSGMSVLINQFKNSPDGVLIKFCSIINVETEFEKYVECINKTFGQAEDFINELCASSIEFEIDLYLVDVLLDKFNIEKEHYTQFKNKKDLNGESKLEKYIKIKNVNEIVFSIEFTTDENLKLYCQIKFILYESIKKCVGKRFKVQTVMVNETWLNLN